jgi:hypothetical protein
MRYIMIAYEGTHGCPSQVYAHVKGIARNFVEEANCGVERS